MKTILVAEIGINHNGDISIAKQLIDVAASAGCQFVKFQKRCISLVYTKEELDALRESPWGKTNREQKEGLEFNMMQYREIDEYCTKKGIGWFASPWDGVSIDDMARLNPPYLKVPSALITNMPYLERIRETKIPVIMSTGMSSFDQVDDAVMYLGTQIEYLLHCTSTYPSKPHEQDLMVINWLKDTYPNYKIGFSNHSPGLTFMQAAVALGAEMLEFHVTLDRSMYGSDQSASIEPEGVFKLVKNVKALEAGLGDGVKKVYDSEYPIMQKLRR